MSDLIAAVKAGDGDAVRALLARDPELAAEQEDGIPAVRLALYHRQPEALAALLAAAPPLDGLDHAALGWADDLRRDVAADPALRNDRGVDALALARACDAVAVLALLGAPTG